MARKHAEEEKENEERWLLTYADLITLLMAFFIVMYAMSQVDKSKFEQLSASLSTAFNEASFSPVPSTRPSSYYGDKKTLIPRRPEETGTSTEKNPAEDLKENLEQLLLTEGIEGKASIIISEDKKRVTVRLAASVLFLPGSDMFETNSLPMLDKIAGILKGINRAVRIEGHTDDIPISSQRFQSNWQLSTARAANVLVYLEKNHQFPPALLSASGYGEYRPLTDNDTPENRATNRRVEFVIDAEY